MAPSVTIEFYGMARRRTGHVELQVNADSVAEALSGAGIDDLAGYLVSINAGPFLADLYSALKSGDHVLVMSADAGG